MLRYNYNEYGTIKEFKNHNINIKLDSDYIKAYGTDELDAFLNIIDSFDTYLISDMHPTLNGYLLTLYNVYSDLCYMIYSNNIKVNETIKLISYTPTDDEIELINEFMNEV